MRANDGARLSWQRISYYLSFNHGFISALKKAPELEAELDILIFVGLIISYVARGLSLTRPSHDAHNDKEARQTRSWIGLACA